MTAAMKLGRKPLKAVFSGSFRHISKFVSVFSRSAGFSSFLTFNPISYSNRLEIMQKSD